MKRLEPMAILVRGTQLLLLILALFIVVWLMPDNGKKDSKEVTTLESDENGSNVSDDENLPGETEMSDESDEPDDSKDSLSEEKDENIGKNEKKRKGKSKPKSAQNGEVETKEEASYEPPVIWLATDLHYQSPKMTDFQTALGKFTATYDGIVVPYLDEITDAFLEEVIVSHPSALLLSGDLSQNGEKVNHEELAKKLEKVQTEGIPVLVIPGNHDINHPWSASYFDDNVIAADPTSSEEFYQIYHQFGYDQASSRASDSLSYVYRLDEKYWLMMLDSCICEPVHETGGKLSDETVVWMKTQLEEAKKQGVTVIPVSHHNLMDESTLYPEECTIENSKEVTALLEEYGVPVYLSGHLHLQRIKKDTSNRNIYGKYGIHEIVTSPLPMSPCQYSVLNWQEDGSLSYHTKKVDVSAWAKRYGEEDENLLNFEEYSKQFMIDVISSQTFKALHSAPKETKEKMAKLYADLNSDYCSGIKIDVAKVKKSDEYKNWLRYSDNDFWVARLKEILNDAVTNNTALELRAGVDFPRPDEISEITDDIDETRETSKGADSPAKEIEAKAIKEAQAETGAETATETGVSEAAETGTAEAAEAGVAEAAGVVTETAALSD